MIDDVRARGNSGSAVFLAGMSGGARIACRYAAGCADQVAAVAAVAGLRAPQVPPAYPVPVVAFHGLPDPRNPYLGGHDGPWIESVPEAARSWAAANGVESERSVDELSSTLRRTRYGGGTPGEVALWTFKNAGHTWPGRPSDSSAHHLGLTSTEVDATDEIGRFFSNVRSVIPGLSSPASHSDAVDPERKQAGP